MLIGTVVFIISWSLFYFFANKKCFLIYTLTGYIGIILALITDLLVFVYPLWEYAEGDWEKFGIQMVNAFGLYFVVIYFFLQMLPKKQTMLSMIRYIFNWTIVAILL